MRLIFSIIILFYIPYIIMSQDNGTFDKPRVISGVLDLSNYNFEKNGAVSLDGDWLFTPNLFVAPQETIFINKSSTIRVPSVWQNEVVNGKKMTSFGYSTYFTRVVLPEKAPNQIALNLPEIGTAYRLYINGIKVVQSGIPAKEKFFSIPKTEPVIVPVYKSEKTWDITIHVSNYQYFSGGIWNSIELGDINEFIQEQEMSSQKTFIFSGIGLMVVIFHLMFFIIRRDDYLSLYFSIFTLIISLYLLSVGDIFILKLLPQITFSVLLKIQFGSFFLSIPIFGAFLKFALPQEMNDTVFRTIFYIGIVSTAIGLILPPTFFVRAVYFYYIFTLFCAIYAIYIIIVAKIKKRESSTILLFSVSIFIFFGINEILYVQGVLQTGSWLHIGLFFFIVSQSIMVNYRFTKSYKLKLRLDNKLESKNLELFDLSHNLEKRIEERTIELNNAYLELKEMALTDELTGLPNRRSIMELVNFEEKLSQRGEHVFTMGLIDIDNFKKINDTYGHDIGDKVLKEVAIVAKNILYQQGKVARWGGEEFLLLFPDSNLEDAFALSEIIRKSIAVLSVPIGESHISVTITMGLCTYQKDLGTQGVIKKADEGLYIGKRNGKNQVVKMI